MVLFLSHRDPSGVIVDNGRSHRITPGPAGSGSTGRSAGPGGGLLASLRLAGIERQVFETGQPYRSAGHLSYFGDLMAAHGRTCDPAFIESSRNTFREMVEALLPRLGPLGERFDVAVLAHSTPDSEPGWPMCFLTGAVPEPGLAFAVSDQGPVTGFTGLRLAADSARTHAARRAQLWVVDQKTLMHGDPVPDRLRPRHDAAVVLVFDEAGPLGGIEVFQFNEVASGDLADRLGPLLSGGASGSPAVLVAGQGLASYWPAESSAGAPVGALAGSPAGAVRWAPPGMPCTGVWSVVAEELPGWLRTGARVVVADYAEELCCLSVCVLEVPAATGTEDI